MTDLRFAFRQLLKYPGFTAVAVLTLALGIGANTAIFSIVDTVLLKPLPYDQPGQLVQVWEAQRPGQRTSVSPGAFLDWKEHNTVFESLSLRQNITLNLVGDGEPERLSGLAMSANGLQILRARPLLGRLFAPDEDQPGKDKVVVLAHRLWQRRFGGETNIPGRTIQIFFEQVLERVRNLPGIESAGCGLDLPMSGSSADTMFKVAGRSGQPDFGYSTDFNFCSPDYFRAAGIPVLQGRSFDPRDRAIAPRVVIINEALAREHFPNRDPIGQRIHMDTFTGKLDDEWEIVGVVGNVRQRGLGENVRSCVYRSLAFSVYGGGGALIIRTSGAPLAMAESVRKAVQEIDPSQPVTNVRTMEEVIAVLVAQRRFIVMLLGGFAGTALLLAALGLYGVIAYSVAQRTREIGIRMALGATRGAVLALVLRHGTRLAGIGVLLGVAGALALTRVLTRLLFEVKPTDPTTFAGVSLLLLLVAVLASWLPARRAAKVHPMEALRCE